jgi:hypothetical protein
MSELTLPIVLLGALAAVCVLVAIAGLYHHRVVTARRLHALEDALRVYNNASAALGRRLLTLESQLVQERRPAANATAPATAPTAATVSPRKRPAAEEEGFSEAELRLAHLIKTRLAGLRLN